VEERAEKKRDLPLVKWGEAEAQDEMKHENSLASR
jgi:hypothetical protein